MNAAAKASPVAWQPLTPSGIAAFAGAPLRHLLGIQFVVALLAAVTIVWFVQTAWCPIVTAAIPRLPEQGEMRGGRLDWRGADPTILGENRFLALAVDMDHGGDARSPAHVQVELGKFDLQVQSLLGFVRLPYWRGWIVPCNRIALTPWWGAWRPPLLALLAAGIIILLLLTWSVLASLYFLPVWLVGFFANRDLSLKGSWRLSGAALMPGALVMCAAIILYRWGMLEVLGLAIAAVAHFVVGWCFLLAGAFCLERHPAVATFQANPFTGSDPVQPSPADPALPKPPQSPVGTTKQT